MSWIAVKAEQSHDSSDEEIVERIRAGQTDLFELLMRRYNQRLYRVARAVLRDDGEAEDVTQDAWVRAFEHLDQFAGRARFSTWLTRIALHEAWARSRRRGRFESIDARAEEGRPMNETARDRDPEHGAFDREVSAVLETAIEALPEAYRSVFVLREMEDLSTADTAECLELTEQTVKTRLHRARGLLRRHLLARVGTAAATSFAFAGVRCDRMVASVLARIGASPVRSGAPADTATPSIH